MRGPKRARRESGASRRAATLGSSSVEPERQQHGDRHIAQRIAAEPDAVDDVGDADDRDREGDREPEHDAERAAPAADAAGGEQRGQHGQHARGQRGAGAGEYREA